jgi:hypothetical protein
MHPRLFHFATETVNTRIFYALTILSRCDSAYHHNVHEIMFIRTEVAHRLRDMIIVLMYHCCLSDVIQYVRKLWARTTHRLFAGDRKVI